MTNPTPRERVERVVTLALKDGRHAVDSWATQQNFIVEIEAAVAAERAKERARWSQYARKWATEIEDKPGVGTSDFRAGACSGAMTIAWAIERGDEL